MCTFWLSSCSYQHLQHHFQIFSSSSKFSNHNKHSPGVKILFTLKWGPVLANWLSKGGKRPSNVFIILELAKLTELYREFRYRGRISNRNLFKHRISSEFLQKMSEFSGNSGTIDLNFYEIAEQYNHGKCKWWLISCSSFETYIFHRKTGHFYQELHRFMAIFISKSTFLIGVECFSWNLYQRNICLQHFRARININNTYFILITSSKISIYDNTWRKTHAAGYYNIVPCFYRSIYNLSEIF